MANDSDGEWKYAIEDVGEDADRPDERAEDESEVANGEGGTDEANEIDREIVAGSPNTENVLFVVLGALLAIVVIARGLGFL